MNKIVVFILSLFYASVSSKKCRLLRNFAFCQERGLEKIPTEVPENIVKLFLHGNHLKSSKALNFQLGEFSRLKELNLKSNELTKFPLQLSTTLVVLDLSNNFISSSEGNPLLKLSRLNALHLASNIMTSQCFSEFNFNPECPLEEVVLDNNIMTSLPSNLPLSVKRLSLVGNKITFVKGDFPELESLDLRGNLLKSFNGGVFPNLIRLNLDDNRVGDVPGGLPGKLKKLHLKGNLIRYLHKSQMENLANLQVALFVIFSLIKNC